MMNFSEALYMLFQGRTITRRRWFDRKLILHDGKFYAIEGNKTIQVEQIEVELLLAIDWVVL